MGFRDWKKQFIVMLMITILFTTTITTLGLSDDSDGGGSFKSHHKVLVEIATRETCPYCPAMMQQIAQVSGDFQYIALEYTKNSWANIRVAELNPSAVPTAYFDGTYQTVVGALGVPALQNAYDNCQARTVADVEVTVSAIWDTYAENLDIKVTVDNYESSTYNGILRIYVIEKNSRFPLYGGQGYYKNACLFYQKITINVGAGSSITQEIDNWTFPDIEKNNLRVVAAAFSGNYVDETGIADPTSGSGGDDDDDDVILPRVRITNPYEGAVVNGTIDITGTADNPGGTGVKWVLVKIDQGGWKTADGTGTWSYTWDTTTVEDGEHTISVLSSDGAKESGIKIITVTVQNKEPDPEDPIPALSCDGTLNLGNVKAGLTIYNEFTVENIGDPLSNLSWAITESPIWGAWIFSETSGDTLQPEDGPQTITITITTPTEEKTYEGEITITNTDDPEQTCKIPVTMSVPKTHPLIKLMNQIINQNLIIQILKIILNM
jgi:hypothetical protein